MKGQRENRSNATDLVRLGLWNLVNKSLGLCTILDVPIDPVGL